MGDPMRKAHLLLRQFGNKEAQLRLYAQFLGVVEEMAEFHRGSFVVFHGGYPYGYFKTQLQALEHGAATLPYGTWLALRVTTGEPDGAHFKEYPDIDYGPNPKRLVFKITQMPRRWENGRLIAPCGGCYRLWRMDDATPRLYDMAEVIGNKPNGSPGQRSRRDWKPTAGRCHPNCVCGPLQYATSVTPMIFPTIAAQFRRFIGQGYPAVDDWHRREMENGRA